MSKTIEVLVKSVTNEAVGINTWEFSALGGGQLPRFTAGAHIDLHLPNGLMRSYSLCNDQEECDRYVVAVNLDRASRGGSKIIHETLQAGDTIRIEAPRNDFVLREDARHITFIAGGIGITPIWSMIQRLETLNRSWQLHYSARTRQVCAFKARLETLDARKPGRVHFNFDHEPGGRVTDLSALVAQLPSDSHLYGCGPNPMLEALTAAAKIAGWPQDHLHVEYFTAKEEPAIEGGFTVVLQRSGKSLQIPPGKTILETLLDHNIDVPFSCMQGICGTCETRVVEGIPEHRDSVLTPEERASNKTMMICCSGCKTAKLVLER